MAFIDFTIVADGETVPCRISCGALGELGAVRCLGEAGLRARYNAHRTTIEALATQKFRAGRASIYGRIDLWATDVGDAAERDDASVEAAPGSVTQEKSAE